jgi:hypothetical protein
MEQNSPWSARSTVGGLSLQGRKQDKVAPISHPVEGEQMLGDEGGRHSAKPPSAVCTTKYGKQARKNLACRIGGCPEICNNAYTARSRVCHRHMKAGKPLRVYPNPTMMKIKISFCNSFARMPPGGTYRRRNVQFSGLQY